MKPSIGRIVHIRTIAGETTPGIITKVNDDTNINVYAFTDEPTDEDEPLRVHGIEQVSGPRDAYPGSWWWPERI